MSDEGLEALKRQCDDCGELHEMHEMENLATDYDEPDYWQCGCVYKNRKIKR